jgi:hypothetical protein
MKRWYGRNDGKFRSVGLESRPSIQTVSKVFATSRRIAPVSFLSPKFLAILSTRLASSKDVLCLGLNPPSREVMGKENGIEDLDQEVYRSLGKMLQSPVR